VRPGEGRLPLVLKPALGCMMLALWPVAVAAGVMDAVVPATGVARREAGPLVSGLTGEEGASDLLRRDRQLGRTLAVLLSKGGPDVAEGGQEVSSRLPALIRWEASA
jgi:hypothetical protein